jgi:hypothetical protein
MVAAIANVTRYTRYSPVLVRPGCEPVTRTRWFVTRSNADRIALESTQAQTTRPHALPVTRVTRFSNLYALETEGGNASALGALQGLHKEVTRYRVTALGPLAPPASEATGPPNLADERPSRVGGVMNSRPSELVGRTRNGSTKSVLQSAESRLAPTSLHHPDHT